MTNGEDFAVAVLAVLLFVPLFLLGRSGPLDFWWWMSGNIALLIALGIVMDKAYFPSLVSDIKSRAAWKIAAGISAAVLLYAVFFAGNALSRWILPFAGSNISRVYQFKEGASLVRLIPLLALLIGPGEEIFWRGFLQRRFQSRFGGMRGWFLATAVYAIVHAGSGNAMLVLAAAACGLFWGFLYLRFRSVLLVAVSHALWDVMVFILVPFH